MDQESMNKQIDNIKNGIDHFLENLKGELYNITNIDNLNPITSNEVLCDSLINYIELYKQGYSEGLIKAVKEEEKKKFTIIK